MSVHGWLCAGQRERNTAREREREREERERERKKERETGREKEGIIVTLNISGSVFFCLSVCRIAM